LRKTMEERVTAIEEWIDVEDHLGETIVNELKAMNRNWEANTKTLRTVIPAVEGLESALYAQKLQLGRLGLEHDKHNEMLLHLKDRADKFDERFDKVDERFDKVDERLDRMDQRFDKVDERLDRMDQRFDKVDERLDKMDQRFDKMDQRFDKTDTKLDLLIDLMRPKPAA